MGLAAVGRGVANGKRLSAWAENEAGNCGTGGEASCEKRRPLADRGGGGVGARSWTERLEDAADATLPARLRRVDEEFFLIKILRSIVDVLDSDGNMIVLLTTAFDPASPS